MENIYALQFLIVCFIYFMIVVYDKQKKRVFREIEADNEADLIEELNKWK